MGPEELLKTLKDAGLDDDSVKKLLTDTLSMLDAANVEEDKRDEKADEADERAQAGQLLGVTL